MPLGACQLKHCFTFPQVLNLTVCQVWQSQELGAPRASIGSPGMVPYPLWPSCRKHTNAGTTIGAPLHLLCSPGTCSSGY